MEIEKYGEERRLKLQRHPVRGEEAAKRGNDDERRVEPVNVLVPVLHGDGNLRNMRLAEVVRLAPERLEVGRAVREGPVREGPGRGR